MLDSLGINLLVTLVQAIIFMALFVVLWKFFFGRVVGAMNRRDEEMNKVLHDIESKQKKVDESLQEYTRRMTEIEQQATLKIQEAVKEGQRVRSEVEAEAKKRSDEELAKGKTMIQRERDQALATLQKEASRLAVQIAEQVLSEPLSGGDARLPNKKAGVS